MNPLGALAARWRVITEWFVTRGNETTVDIAWGDVQDVDLTVGQQGPNAWGLYDMHGGVEEWTLDWYGPYVASDTVDPVGYADGIARVVRGGSHGVQLQTLRSANRSAALVSDKHFLLGFRVVRVPKGQALPAPTLRQPVGRDANGKEATIRGTFAALSWDEGETWPIKRVLSDVRSGSRSYVMAPWDRSFTLDATHGQPQAYWAATQTPDGIVHLSDGRLHYAFNLAWLTGGS